MITQQCCTILENTKNVKKENNGTKIINVSRSYTSIHTKDGNIVCMPKTYSCQQRLTTKYYRQLRKTLNQSLIIAYQMRKHFLWWLVRFMIVVVLLKSFSLVFATSCGEGYKVSAEWRMITNLLIDILPRRRGRDRRTNSKTISLEAVTHESQKHKQ